MMTKRLKYKKGSKFIARCRVKNHLNFTREEHDDPDGTYFDRVRGEHSLLSIDKGSKKVVQVNKDSLSQFRSKSHLAKAVNPHQSSLASQANQSGGQFQEIKSVFNQTRISTFTIEQPRTAAKSKKISMSQTMKQMQKLDEQKRARNKELYMSYLEYQEILKEGDVRHSFWEKKAKTNDRRLLSEADALQAKTDKSPMKNARGESCEEISKSEISVVACNKKRRNKTELGKTQGSGEVQSIISSKVGALSNQQILEKLEHKWRRQQENKKPQMNMTEQSEFGSQKDSKRVSMKTSLFWAAKKRNEDNSQHNIYSLKKFGYEGFSKHLQRILILDEEQVKPESNLYSRGEEYSTRESEMMEFQDIYAQRKNLLKHKFDWKV